MAGIYGAGSEALSIKRNLNLGRTLEELCCPSIGSILLVDGGIGLGARAFHNTEAEPLACVCAAPANRTLRKWGCPSDRQWSGVSGEIWI